MDYPEPAIDLWWWCMNWRTLHIKPWTAVPGRWWSAIYLIIVRGVPCCARMRTGNEYEYDESIQNSGIGFDGTLLDAQSRITPENARAVRMAQQAGVQISAVHRTQRARGAPLQRTAGSRTGLARHRKRRGSAASG